MDLLPANTSDKIPPYMDVPASLIPGWPGYRTRPGRSGLDYLDSEFELAHMQGLFLRRLFTGKLRTTKPVYLAAMAVLGAMCILPTVLAFIAPTLDAVCPGMAYFIPMAVGGGGLLYNLALNLRREE